MALNSVDSKQKLILAKFINPWVVVLSASTFLFLINILQNIFNSINPFLIEKFNFSIIEMGLLFSCYYYSNILFVIPAGILIDKMSVRKILLIAFIMTNFSVLIFTITKSLYIMALSRLILGVAGSFSGLSYFKLITRWFSPREIGFVSGVISSFATCGSLFSQVPLVLIIENFGLQKGLLLVFWLGMILFFLAILFVWDFSAKKTITKRQANTEKINVLLPKTILNQQNWLVGIYCSLVSLPTLFLGASWGNLYLQKAHGLTTIQGAYITSMIFVGSIIGGPFIGWGADKLRSRKLPLIVGTAVSVIILIFITYLNNLTFIPLMLLFLFLGIVTSCQVICYPLIAESNAKSLTGTAIGFISALTALNGIYIYGISWIMQFTQIAKTNNYNLIMIILIGLVVMSLILTLFMQDTYAKQYGK